MNPICPRCKLKDTVVKSGMVNKKQRFLCKPCKYHFTVGNIGKKIDNYYIVKSIQLYLEGLSLREIERVIGISHSTISNWIKEYNIVKPNLKMYDPSYKILTYEELREFFSDEASLKEKGLLITELGAKYLIIRWKITSENDS